MARIARVSGVSQAHFARLFRQAFGVPPHRYLLTLRLERAKALLRDGELSVTEVAMASGWRSLGSFSRTFRDVCGQSPTDYRDTADPSDALEGVPACFARAAHRPDLKTAVLEKRRRQGEG